MNRRRPSFFDELRYLNDLEVLRKFVCRADFCLRHEVWTPSVLSQVLGTTFKFVLTVVPLYRRPVICHFGFELAESQRRCPKANLGLCFYLEQDSSKPALHEPVRFSFPIVTFALGSLYQQKRSPFSCSMKVEVQSSFCM